MTHRLNFKSSFSDLMKYLVLTRSLLEENINTTLMSVC